MSRFHSFSSEAATHGTLAVRSPTRRRPRAAEGIQPTHIRTRARARISYTHIINIMNARKRVPEVNQVFPGTRNPHRRYDSFEE